MKNIVAVSFMASICLAFVPIAAKASDNRENTAVTAASKALPRLAVVYIPYSPYTYAGTTSAGLERCLQDAMKSNAFRPNGPFMYDTIIASKQQIALITEIFDTKVTPARYPSGEAEILVEDLTSGKQIFVDQFGVVKTNTRQYRLKAITFERLHDLMRHTMPPRQPSTTKQPTK